MLKRSIIIILFFMSVFMTYAEDFSGYKYPGDKFSLNGDNFSLQISNDWKTLYLKYNSESLIFDEDTCRLTEKQYYLICFGNAKIDWNANPEIGYLDDKTGKEVPGINITIKYRKPDIEITRAYTKTDPLVFEVFDVLLTIENKGKNPASVIYSENISNDFMVTPGDGVIYDGKKLTYVAKLGMGSKKTFNYKLKPLKHFSCPMNGKLDYVYEDFIGTINPTVQTITVKETIELLLEADIEMNVAQKGEMIIDLNNLDTKLSSDVELNITFPEELILTNSYPATESEISNVFSYSEYFPKKDDDKIKIGFLSTITGDYIAKLTLKYEVNGLIRVLPVNISIKVGSSQVEPQLEIPEGFLGSNEKIIIKGKLKNYDSSTPYYNINIEVNSQILKEFYNIPKIVQNQEILIIDKEVVLPTFKEKTDIEIILSGNYENINKEKFEFEIKKTINVYPPTDTVIIYHTFDKYTNDTDKAKVIVSVENKRNKNIKNLLVNEDIPSNLKVLEGETNNLMTLEPNKKTQAYYYTVQAICNDSKNNNITTYVKFKETDKEFILSQTLNLDIVGKQVETKKLDTELIDGAFDVKEELNEEIVNSTKTEEEKQTEETKSSDVKKEKNIFKKFIDWLFSWWK